MLPTPPVIGVGAASTSVSVSPSPFAPPPASTSISRPVSQLIPPLSSSSSSHPSIKAKSPDAPVSPDQQAISGDLDVSERPEGSEHVTERASPSDDGGASLNGNSTAGLPSYPDRLQARSPSLQVCPPSRIILLSACVYAYESCDRVQCRPRITSIVHRHHAHLFLHGTHRKLLCSFLPRPGVSHPLAPPPIRLLQSETAIPNHQTSYRLTLHRPRRHRHVDLAAMHLSSQSPRSISKDGK